MDDATKTKFFELDGKTSSKTSFAKAEIKKRKDQHKGRITNTSGAITTGRIVEVIPIKK